MLSHRKKGRPISNDYESAVARLLERFVTILLRLGFDSPRAESLVRQAFVLEAAKAARQLGGKSTQSKIALLAGVNRLDVRRILSSQNRNQSSRTQLRQSRVERILAAWSEDPMFATQPGRPKPLTFVGANSQFEKLVRKYGRDITARTLREDLLKNKLVAQKGPRLTIMARARKRNSYQYAALTDLAFLDSQLAQFNFSQGRREYSNRTISLFTNNSKLLKLAQRKALAKIETTLNSLEFLQGPLAMPKEKRSRGAHQLRITAVISSESAVAKD